MTNTGEQTTTPRALWCAGIRVTPLRCAGRTMALELVHPAGVPGPPPHYHEDCAEFFYVTAGRVGVLQGDGWVALGSGEYCEVPRGVLHTFRNDGDGEARMITGFEPVGFEAFFEEFGVDADEPGAREASTSPEAIQRLVEGCHRFGMIVPPEVLQQLG